MSVSHSDAPISQCIYITLWFNIMALNMLITKHLGMGDQILNSRPCTIKSGLRFFVMGYNSSGEILRLLVLFTQYFYIWPTYAL